MVAVTVQVFEHTTHRIGGALPTTDGAQFILTEGYQQQLASFADSTRNRYLSCGRRTVRFSSYVGLIQVGELGIEILPKADRGAPGGHARWHRALMRMLRVAGNLGLKTQDEASRVLRPGRLFELFLGRFLDETERLTHEGLARSYRTQAGNSTAFKGRLMVAQHIRANASNGARFYVASPVYDHRSLPNLALNEALKIIDNLPVSAATRIRARAVRHRLPELPPWTPTPAEFGRIRLNRQAQRYGQALGLARLILFDLAPDIRHGGTPLLALLFDMNLLWERYVAALARRLPLHNLIVATQDSRLFWRSPDSDRTLRPDITIRDPDSGEVRLVIDTKWKVPVSDRPSGADLKQMFCYHELFDCSHSLLLYPSSSPHSRHVAEGRYPDRGHRTASAFLAIDGNVSADLMTMIAEAIPAGPLEEANEY